MYYSAGTILPDVEISMKTAGYWISKHPYPDKIIMDQMQIKKFNAGIFNSNLNVKNLTDYALKPCIGQIIDNCYSALNYLEKQKLYFTDGKPVNLKFYKAIRENMNIDQLGSSLSYGFTVKTCSLRILPTNTMITDVSRELFFDSLQASSLNIAVPVLISGKTIDGKWAYVIANNVEGWLETENFAVCSLDKYNFINSNKNFLVIISNKADIYLDENATKLLSFSRMGAKYNIIDEMQNGLIKIYIPFRDNNGLVADGIGYIKRSDINIGYLPYTPRIIIEQAFKLLNSPYGWGGMYGELDCSQLLCEIFATVGIILPRNSANQCKIGQSIDEFNSIKEDDYTGKINTIKEKGIPGITFFRLPGHIMLYLGYENDNIYAIHSTWAYKEKIYGVDTVRLINKVTVSTLNLGNGTKKGSLLKRINRMNLIMN
jgi:hypothetical protein